MLLIFLLCLTPFSADKVEIIRENGKSIVHLLGNVVIEDENTRITCSEASLNQTENYVVLIQDVKIVDENGEIKSNFAVYYFKEKKMRGEGFSMLKDRPCNNSNPRTD